MSHLKSIERLSCILKFINLKPYATLKQILNEFEEKEIYTTERTLQRDFKTLRETFFINVEYNSTLRGYFINSDYDRDYNDWMHVFELFNKAKVINEILLKDNKSIDYIDFDRNQQLTNEVYFEQFLRSIIGRKQVEITYQSYWKDESELITICPYLLKQYQNRWYIFGSDETNLNRSYGLERITEVKVLDNGFKPNLKDPKSLFNDVVGINFSENKLDNVVLSYEAFQGNYLKSQPLHPRQKILIDTEEEFRIELRIRPNYELEEQLLKQAEKVEVIAPLWLRNRIKERMEKALKRYL
jgi:predicted DNA-binding transcriptional regulator YafY